MNRKIHKSESYEDVIRSLIDDTIELSEESKKNIERSMKDIEAGRTHSFEEVKKRYGL